MDRRLIWLSVLPAATAVAAALAVQAHAAFVADRPTVAVALPAVDPALVLPAPDAVVTPTSGAAGEVSVTTGLDRGAVLAGADGLVRMEVKVKSTHEAAAGARVPTDLVVVLDRSGSMQGNKIADARAAAIALLDQLDAEDRFALVSFSGDARVDVPLAPATDVRKGSWTAQIGGISAGGSTQMQAGLQRAEGVFDGSSGRARRTILVSDGLPDSADGLDRLAREAAVGERPLTTVGIGVDYDEVLMTRLADLGTGNFYWAEQGQDLAARFADEFSAARETVATGVALRVDLPQGVELVDAAGYRIDRAGDARSVALGSLFAQQERTLWLTFRVATDGATASLPGVTVAWTNTDGAPGLFAAAATRVDVVRDDASFVAAIDKDRWGRSQVGDEYASLKLDVARLVKAGDEKKAKEAIAAYRAETEALNRQVGSALVTSNLAEVDELEEGIDEAFTGADQAAKQNLWSKTATRSGYQSRRAGSSKSY